MIEHSPSGLPFPLQLYMDNCQALLLERETVWIGQLIGPADHADQAQKLHGASARARVQIESGPAIF